MNQKEEHVSPDGILRFVIRRDDEDVSLGFTGYSWHTHADVLAATYQTTADAAVTDFVEALLNDRSIIAVSKVAGIIQDVWITDDPDSDLRYKPEAEEIEFRYWSGQPWQAS
jgi:hypothetical protein